MGRGEGLDSTRGAELEVGIARKKETDKVGFVLVTGEKLVHQRMGMKGFSIKVDREKINFHYVTKRMR